MLKVLINPIAAKIIAKNIVVLSNQIKPFIDHICMTVIPAMVNKIVYYYTNQTSESDPDILGDSMCYDYPFGDS